MRSLVPSRYPTLASVKQFWCVPAALAVLLLLGYATYLYNWPAGIGLIGALYGAAWMALAYPAAREEFGAALRNMRGYQIAVVILFLSCYVEGFLSDIALRASTAMKESPANPANLGRAGLIAAGTLLAFYLARGSLDRLPRGFTGPLRGMVLFAMVAVLSSTYSSLPIVSAGKALELLADVGAFVLLASLLSADDFRHSWNTLWLIMGLLLIGVWVSAFIFPSQGFEYQAGAAFPLLTGVYPNIHPNTLGQLGATLAVVALCRLMRDGSRLLTAYGFFWGGMFLLGFASMIGAEARTAIGSFAVAAMVCIYLYRRFTLLLYFGIGAVALLGLGAVTMIAEYMRRGQSADLMFSLSGRFAYWLPAWNMFQSSPLVGHGFYTAHRIDLNASWHKLDLSSVDNTYLELLLGIGIAGVLPLVIALVTLVRRIFSTLGTCTADTDLADAQKQMIGFVIIALIRSTTGPTFQIHGENLIFLLLVMGFVHAVRQGRLRPPVTLSIRVASASVRS